MIYEFRVDGLLSPIDLLTLVRTLSDRGYSSKTFSPHYRDVGFLVGEFEIDGQIDEVLLQQLNSIQGIYLRGLTESIYSQT
jgi:hypothetical protein